MYVLRNKVEEVYENMKYTSHAYMRLNGVMHSQYIDQEIQNVQQKKLKETINLAYKTKFYKKKFDEVGFDGRCRCKDDLTKLPILSKKDIKENFFDMIVPGYPLNKCIRNRTSGSTGEPTMNLQDYRIHDEIFNTNFLRARMAYGKKGFERMLMIVPKHYAIKNLIYPEYAINNITCDKVWQIHPEEEKYNFGDIFNKVQPDIIYGNPHLLLYVAEKIENIGLRVKSHLIISSFEMLSDKESEYLSKVFCGEVLNIYGCSEIGDIAWSCPVGKGFHINEEDVIVEVVNENNECVYDEEGDIVVTSLYNFPMPIIRYRVGDKGIITKKECECGRKLRILKEISGRSVDFIKLKDGRSISPYTIMNKLNFLNIIQFQIIQEQLGKIAIYYVGSINPETKNKIEEKLNELFGGLVELDFVKKDKLIVDSSGKLKTVHSCL